MASCPQAEPAAHPPISSPPPVEESRAQLAAAAEQLHALAEATRAQMTDPRMRNHPRCGRTQAFKRDCAEWLQRDRIAGAFEAAAERLDAALQMLRIHGC